MTISLRQLGVRMVPASLRPLVTRIWNKAYSVRLKSEGRAWSTNMAVSVLSTDKAQAPNDLETYFNKNLTGPGIWKWRHYFPIYERHFARFRGRPVRVLEIGIYSGGSLGMWRSYFGPDAHIIGLDIEDSCRVYASDHVQIEIGDQSDRNFWRSFKQKVPPVDIIIDDGGHLPKQQKVTLEELLSHLNPGGVYLCEDITGESNPFHAFVEGSARALHAMNRRGADVEANAFQRRVSAIHNYPYVCVMEIHDRHFPTLRADKHGTQWQPFFERP